MPNQYFKLSAQSVRLSSVVDGDGKKDKVLKQLLKFLINNGEVFGKELGLLSS